MYRQKPSDKLHVIDHSTYEKLQQSSSSCSKGEAVANRNKPIRNAKYKKTRGHSDFNLLNFLTHRKPQKATQRERRKLRTKCVVSSVATLPKRRGKTREGGRKKKFSRLKKSILRYRKQKRLQEHMRTAMGQLESLSLEPTFPKCILGVHSRRFRAYCNNCTTPLLEQLTEKLLRELNRFQRRAYAQNEIKARAHRRFVVGFREMQNYLRINKVKLAIIAPDCEEIAGEDGLDATILAIKTQCQSQQVPYAFALKRRQLAYALYKKVPVSCVTILDYDGARDIYAQLLEALQEARRDYEALLLEKQTVNNESMSIEEINA